MSPHLRLGVLTWYKGSQMEERNFFTHLAKEAEKLNTEILLFSPHDILPSGMIRALVYQKDRGGWQPKLSSPPDLVYDRFRNMEQKAFKSFVQFRSGSKMKFINSRLAHKWNLHCYLDRHPTIRKWLPETLFLEDVAGIYRLLGKYHQVYLKPVNGTGGKGILSITQKSRHLALLGRDWQRKKMKRTIPQSSLATFVSNWTKDKKYIVQQGLKLQWEPHVMVDFRLLVQKDAVGKWSITGMGGKIGGKDSATSNLHGGGKAVDVEQILGKYFPPEKYKKQVEECHQLGLLIAEYLEEKFGRLVELGIDLGIDRDGAIWIIEVNPKPGRDIFRLMGKMNLYWTAVRRPIEYALYVFKEEG